MNADHAEASRTFEERALACLPHIERFARSLARDASAAEDLVQDTYLLAFRGRGTFATDGDMRRWLFSICHHAWLRTVQREQRVVLTDDGDEAELETLAAVMGHVTAQRSGLDRFVGSIDVGPAIAAAIDRLSPPMRVVVVLVDVQGFGYDEAATVLDVPVGTIRSRLFRARRVLQERLFEFARDAGFTVSATGADRHPRASDS
ncbi:sigma-70 family RNA polymerase sigma factor [Gemmatimonas sp.]